MTDRVRTSLLPGCRALIASALLAGCASAPDAARAPGNAPPQTSESVQGDTLAKAVGPLADAFFRLSRRPYEDPGLVAYVAKVGASVAAPGGGKSPFEFTVFDDTEVNAWSIPRGRVYVSRAILAVLGSEGELAAVLAHEIAHQRLGHSMQSFRASTLGLEDLSCGSGLDWDQEYQADRLGLTLLLGAGYSPSTMFRMLRGLYASDDSRDAASQARGLSRLARLTRELEDRRGGRVNTDEYLQHVDGLVWGDDPRNGLVRKDAWECARCGFALRFPKGWKVEGEALTVSATSPRGDAKLSLDGWPVLEALPFGSAAVALIQSQEFEQRSVAGMTAYVAWWKSSEHRERYAVLEGGDRVWRLHGTGAGADRLDEVLSSMRPFGAKDVVESPLRIRVRRTQRASSMLEVATGLCEDKAPSRTIGWLNGKELDEQVEAGTLVKCVGR